MFGESAVTLRYPKNMKRGSTRKAMRSTWRAPSLSMKTRGNEKTLVSYLQQSISASSLEMVG